MYPILLHRSITNHNTPFPLFQMSISKGSECVLLDNSQKIKWRVRNGAGQEGMVPAVCFLIPPPNDEAKPYIDR